MPSPEQQTPADTRISLNLLTLPSHANAFGKIHGGTIMKMVDEAGGICSMRHARCVCVTVAIDSMTFDSAVEVGELLCCDAVVCYVGRTAIEVEVKVHAEGVTTGEITHTNSAFLVYVAIGDDGKPVPVPGLRCATDEDRRRWLEGEARQRARKARRGHPRADAGA